MKKAFDILCYYLGRHNRWYVRRYYTPDTSNRLQLTDVGLVISLYANLAVPVYMIIGPMKVNYFSFGMLLSFFTLYPLLRRYIGRNQDSIMATFDALGNKRPWHWPVLVIIYIVVTWLSMIQKEELRLWLWSVIELL